MLFQQMNKLLNFVLILAMAKAVSLFVDPNNNSSLEPTSPRSVDACLHLGVEACELKFISKHHFLKNLGDSDLAELAFQHHEDTRQVKSQSLAAKNAITCWSAQPSESCPHPPTPPHPTPIPIIASLRRQ